MEVGTLLIICVVTPFLLIQPSFRIKFIFFLAKLEVKDSTVIVGSIAIDGTKHLLGAYIVALLDIALGEVAIDGDIRAVTY